MAKLKGKNIASPHTIKKFELMNHYVDEWARKILGIQNSEGIVFLDCMCNSGYYHDKLGNPVDGTPLRIARTLNSIAGDYPGKKITIFFNDIDSDKIKMLQSGLDAEHLSRIEINYQHGDANDLLIHFPMNQYVKYHKLLFYDPYVASINWKAINPFLTCWGEVIINHMVSDTIRGASQAIDPIIVQRYEATYEKNIDELLAIGNDRKALDKIIIDIASTQISDNRDKDKTFIASFPFYNQNNGLVYNLIFCGHNIVGFKLFKRVAWKTFGGKSSMKSGRDLEGQLAFDLDNPTDTSLVSVSDDQCYCVADIAGYIYDKYHLSGEVPLNTIWEDLDVHPVFPSDGYRREIKNLLRDMHGTKSTKTSIIFN